MELIFFWLMCAVAAAVIGAAKGRSGFGWLILGLLLGIFAVIIVACLPSLKRQTFVMQNPDGTATVIQSVSHQQPVRSGTNATELKVVAVGIAVLRVVGFINERSEADMAWRTIPRNIPDVDTTKMDASQMERIKRWDDHARRDCES